MSIAFHPATPTHSATLPKHFSYLSSPFFTYSPRLSFSHIHTNRRNTTRIFASSSPIRDEHIIVGCGGASMDYLVMVDNFPKPDSKIKMISSKIQGGGNVGNALTCAARLGLKPRIITKMASDSEGRSLVKELEEDGVDSSFIVVCEAGRSMFSHVIVDCKMKTRTAIYHPGHPPLIPDDISISSLSSALNGAELVYFDGLSIKTALVVAKEASYRGIPILVDAEMGEDGFEELLNMASYAVCSAKYPQAWSKAPTIPTSLVSMLMKLPNLKFVIVTLGEDGCIMLQRSENNDTSLEKMDVDRCFELLKKRSAEISSQPSCVSSETLKLTANEVGQLNGRLFVATAERIPPTELVDTTGAGDAFIGAVLYALCVGMPPETMLPFACQVAAGCCRALGARTGLPHLTDQRLQHYMSQSFKWNSAIAL